MVVQRISTVREAVQDIFDGATLMVGGFGGVGAPSALLAALLDQGARGLTLITNDCMEWTGRPCADWLVRADRVRRVIASFPVSGSAQRRNATEERALADQVEVEVVPQGTLAERIRAGGAGIGAFYTPTGVGTVVAKGKEVRTLNGREYLLELPLAADFALVHAYRADPLGNLVYRKAARNFNPVMATAARVTIAEVEELVEVGELDPEEIVTPSIYVHRLVVVGGPS